MERWEAACIWLSLAIPTRHTDITCGLISFLNEIFLLFYYKMFHLMHLFFFLRCDCISGKISNCRHWCKAVILVQSICRWVGTFMGLKASRQLTLTKRDAEQRLLRHEWDPISIYKLRNLSVFHKPVGEKNVWQLSDTTNAFFWEVSHLIISPHKWEPGCCRSLFSSHSFKCK